MQRQSFVLLCPHLALLSGSSLGVCMQCQSLHAAVSKAPYLNFT